MDAVNTGMYTLEINSITPKVVTIKKETSPLRGQEVPILKASFTIVDDEKYSGRKLWKDFWFNEEGGGLDGKQLKKVMSSTGVIQEEGQSLEQWASQFEHFNPPARFQVPVEKIQDPKNPDPKSSINRIKFFGARALG